MLHCYNRSEFKNTWKGTGSVTGNCRLDGTPPETLLPVLRKEFSWENETKPCGPRFVSKCLTLKGTVDLSFLVGLDAVAPGATSPGFSRWKTCDKNFFRWLHGWRCFDCRGSILAAPGHGVLFDYWIPCSGDYPDDQFRGVFPTNVKITLRRKYSKRTFPFPWSFFTQARPIT